MQRGVKEICCDGDGRLEEMIPVWENSPRKFMLACDYKYIVVSCNLRHYPVRIEWVTHTP